MAIRHASPISGVDAHGTLIATAGYDNRVILWNGRTGAALTEVRHDHLANQCRFSASGTLLATSSSDYTARLWSVPDLHLVAVLGDQQDDVEMTVISPDERLVATASRDHVVRVYDLQGRLVHRMEGHRSDVLSVEWVDDSRQLVTTSDDGTVRRWDVASGRLLRTVDLGDVETDTVAVLGDDTVVLGNDEGQLVVVDGSGEPTFVDAHSAGIKRLARSPSGVLLSASYDRTIKFWQVAADGGLTLVRTATVPSQVWLRSCAALDDGRWAFGTFGTSYAVYDYATDSWDLSGVAPTWGINAVAEDDGEQVTVGDAGTVRRGPRVLSELGSCCNFLFPFGPAIVSGGQTGEVFDARTGKVLHRHRSPLNCATGYVAADGTPTLLVGTYTGEALRFSLRAGEIAFVDEVRLHDNAIKGIAASADRVFSVCATGAAAVHALPDLQLVRYVDGAHERIANGAVALSDGRFASIGRDLMLRLWSSEGDPVAAVRTPHRNSVKCVAFDPRSGMVATGDYHGRVARFDLAAGTWAEEERPTTAGVSSLCAAPAPGTFWASSYDGTVYRVGPDPAGTGRGGAA